MTSMPIVNLGWIGRKRIDKTILKKYKNRLNHSDETAFFVAKGGFEPPTSGV